MMKMLYNDEIRVDKIVKNLRCYPKFAPSNAFTEQQEVKLQHGTHRTIRIYIQNELKSTEW